MLDCQMASFWRSALQCNDVVALDIVPEKVAVPNQKKSPIGDDEIEGFLVYKSLNFRATLDKTASVIIGNRKP
jgi:UDP-glucose 6-dehydrogenase